ncbi:quinoprotein relay system zinc metallohydrolase 2 [Prosthecomicrobium sp. N25]|uniref:quinoprotein relay system zinc metallohydrolase 2 n=1 Tax=Prosthecomicrobium sp. N25 TaxID=3129254 RepID=UPI003077A99D
MRHFDPRSALARLAAVAAAVFCCAAAWADEPLPVTEVAPGVFVYQAPYQLAAPANGGAVGNVGFVVGGEAVAVIDTGGSAAAGRRLLAAVRARTDLPIRYVINTHFHPDHTLGNVAFRDGTARFVGHRNLRAALAARAQTYLDNNRRIVGAAAFEGTEIIYPDEEVADTRRIDLGGRTLVLEAQPTAHTNTDLTVFDEATRTWWLADLLFVRHTPAVDGSINGWLKLIEKAKTRPADRVVPGHGPAALPWPDAIAPEERYLERLRRDVRAMVSAGRTMAAAAREAGLSERDAWDLFDDFNARNATAVFREMEWE